MNQHADGTPVPAPRHLPETALILFALRGYGDMLAECVEDMTKKVAEGTEHPDSLKQFQYDSDDTEELILAFSQGRVSLTIYEEK